MVRQSPDAVAIARATPVDEIDLSRGAIWARQIDRYELFRTLRAERPVSFHREAEIENVLFEAVFPVQHGWRPDGCADRIPADTDNITDACMPRTVSLTQFPSRPGDDFVVVA